MTNSADPDQLKPTDLDLHCLLRQGMTWLAREGLSFSKLLEKPVVKYLPNEGILWRNMSRGLPEGSQEWCLCDMCFNFLYTSIMVGTVLIWTPRQVNKSICCGYSSELPRQVEAIQMSTHNICYYKEVGIITWTAIWGLQNCLTVGL